MSLKYSDSVIPSRRDDTVSEIHTLTDLSSRAGGSRGLSGASPARTCVDGGFSGGHRHVGRVGDQGRSLHDALRLPVHLHGELRAGGASL